jgi:hypothetical protein
MEKLNDPVFCIFSYNRYEYLKNLIDSIDIFFPEVPVVIFDDNSDQEDLLIYYRDLSGKEGFKIEKLKAYTDQSKHGGLYNLMNMALKYCWEKNFSYAFFIQDDMQFVQDLDLNAICREYFTKWPDALMVSPLFMQKIFLPDINNYVEKKDDDYLFRNYGVADAGIIHLNRAKTVVLNFSARGERHNGEKYYKLGYKLVLCKNPCLAWVPWAISYKDHKRIGRFFYKADRLYINPLTDENRLQLMYSEALPFLENYTRLNIWWIPKPYIHLIYSFKNVVLSYWKYVIYVIFKK